MRKTARLLIACLVCLALVFAGRMPVAAAEQSPEAIQCADFDGAVQVLREKMVQRQQVVTVRFESDNGGSEIARALYHAAMEHTGVPTQGDYLYRHLEKCNMQILTGYLSDGRYDMTLTYTFTYRSTAEQEAQVDAAVRKLLDQLDVYNANDYEKVCAIYDYICRNITYATEGLENGDPMVYTAYAALVDGSSVCQGYASLFYRLALELGIDARVISGTGNGGDHAWNIVRLGEKYYNLDGTWDAIWTQAGLPYAFFLRCDANFEDHYREEPFNTELFYREYVMSDTDYDASAPQPRGDLTGDRVVNEEDAIYLLQYVLMPEDFPVEQNVDLDKNGAVDEDDAIYLLQYILMPEIFSLK